MKKMLRILLVLVMFLCNISFVSASDGQSVYFQTENTSSADNYVKDNVYELLLGHTDNDMKLCNNIILGGGIKVNSESNSEYYLYPMYYNNKVIFVCRVYYDGQKYSSVLSEGLAEEFNELKSSEDTVYSLAISNENLILIDNDNVKLWAEDKDEGKQYSKSEVLSLQKKKNYSQKKNINISLGINRKNQKAIETRAYYNLAIDYLEQQTNLPWCVGYAGANIIRYMTGNSYVYASTIAQFGSVGSNSAIPLSTLSNYARAFAGISAKTYNGIANLTYSVIEGQLKLKQPIMGIFQKNGNSSERRAIVVHGINGGTVKVRNPWYKYSETYPLTNYAYVATNGTKWIQDAYMSFKK